MIGSETRSRGGAAGTSKFYVADFDGVNRRASVISVRERDFLHRASLLGRQQSDALEMERQMVGSRVYSIETNSDNSVEQSINIVRSKTGKGKKKKRLEEAKKLTLSTALARSIQAMNTGFGFNATGGGTKRVGNSVETLRLGLQNNSHNKHSHVVNVENCG